MTDAQYEYLCSYLRRIADLLGLKDVDLEVKRECADESSDGYVASIETQDGLNWGRLTVSQHFWSDEHYSNRDRGPIIAQECLHLHERPRRNMIEVDLRPYMSEREHATFYQGYKRATEYAIDRESNALAALLPAWEPPPDGTDR